MKNIVTATLFVVLATSNLRAADWPQFLGPTRNGISAETNLIDSFPPTGPAVAWRTPLGIGMSNVAVAEGAVYTLFQDNAAQYVVALAEDSGDRRWKTRVAANYSNGQGPGPRGTPSVDDGEAFAFTGDGVLCSLTAQ